MTRIPRIITGTVACVALSHAASGQDQPPVFRAGTELVQTDVMVFDTDGRFVDGLRPEDFELRIDGQVKPITFLERVSAGSAKEAQLRARRDNASAEMILAPPVRGRTLFFYVDDLHLDMAGLDAVQKLVGDFIEDEMNEDDEAAIYSASGEVGFLQQLTGNRTVLRKALQLLKLRPNSIRDLERPPMSHYQAFLIDRYDREVTAYFVQETMRNNPGITAPQAENIVKGRSHALMQQAGQITASTLAGLERLIRTSSELPGRKLVFFLSGGFLLDPTDARGSFRRITSVAARSGTVIYSLDARGLVASVVDASQPRGGALLAELARVSQGELSATQDGLVTLARNTGGRAVVNTNALEGGLMRALEETSVYYMLAWEPDSEMQKAGTFRTLEVRLPARPELAVRVRRGFFDIEPEPVDRKRPVEKRAQKTPDGELADLIARPLPLLAVPISLGLNYLFTPERRAILAAAVQIPDEFLGFSAENGKQKATVRIAGMVLNERGQGVSFTKGLTVNRDGSTAPKGGGHASYTHHISLGPGLYQVRIAARDDKSGRAGSAQAWIEIPDLVSSQLVLSSIIVGDPKLLDLSNLTDEGLPATVQMNVDRRFPRESNMRFVVFAHNATKGESGGRPDLAVQVRILSGHTSVTTMPFRRMATEGADVDHLPYAADVSLADLPPGRYMLEVTVLDRVSNASATQQTRFEIQ